MRRFRAKLVGFGLAALAGSVSVSVHAADPDWLTGGPARVEPPATVIPAGGAPAVLPASVRFAAATDGNSTDGLWLSAPPRPEPSRAVPPASLPVQLPEVAPVQPAGARSAAAADYNPVATPGVGPRVGNVPQPPVSELPPRVNVYPAPTQPTLPTVPPTELPPPRTSDSPPPMVKPVPPPGYLPDVPRPGSLPPVAPQAECPVAPPELMVPAGGVTPGKHGTFGTPPMRLSRDYASLADLCGTSLRPGTGVGAGAGDGGGGFERGYIQGEFLLWWAKSLDIPILGTTNNAGGFGFLNEPGTSPILGPGTFVGSFRQGFRGRAGLWFDDSGSCGIDGSFFFLARRTADTTLASSAFPIITRPIFSPNLQGGIPIGQTGEAVAVPGILTGSLSAHAESLLWGFDANIRKALCCGCDRRATWFVGYRNVNLSESLSITENINVVGNGAGRVLISDPVGSVVVVQDRFGTDNHFNGGQIGGTYERRWGRLSFDARGSVALGVTHQELDISGFQTRTRPGQPPMTFRGGLLAAGPNLGTFSRNSFSVVPEVTLNAGVWLTPTVKIYAGYNFLFWSNVIRPGDQIDPVVDLTFVPNAPGVAPSGQNRPRPPFRQTDLWVTGVQFGLEWRW
jgi:hypothetical protein